MHSVHVVIFRWESTYLAGCLYSNIVVCQKRDALEADN